MTTIENKIKTPTSDCDITEDHQSDTNLTGKSIEETDLLARSNKKVKITDGEACGAEEMMIEQPMIGENVAGKRKISYGDSVIGNAGSSHSPVGGDRLDVDLEDEIEEDEGGLIVQL